MLIVRFGVVRLGRGLVVGASLVLLLDSVS